MITDVTGISLMPGNRGMDCLGNGKHFNKNGNLIECCCDECNYLMCCVYDCECESCSDDRCERNQR